MLKADQQYLSVKVRKQSRMDEGTYPKVDLKEEDITRFEDEHGNVMRVVGANGHFLSARGISAGRFPDPRVNFKRLRDLELRSDDVFICAYPKAGTHWVSEIVCMLRKQKPEYDVSKKEVCMIEFNTPENLGKLPSPRTFNSHLRFDVLPQQILAKKCKIIFIERNPKDIAVSYLYHCRFTVQFKGTFDHFLQYFMSKEIYHEPWAEYILDWEKVIKENPELQVLRIFYEDIKQNPETEIKKIASFLSCGVSDELASEIAQLCSFQNLKEASKTVKEGGDDSFFYRKGQVGDWKNYFTVAQSEKFDEFLEQKMKETKSKYRYEI